MDAPSSQDTLAPPHPLPTLVASKATGAMAQVPKKVAPKKQQPSSTTKCLRALNETKSDEDGLVFRKKKVAPPLDETTAPQMNKVKPNPQVPPSPPPHHSKN